MSVHEPEFPAAATVSETWGLRCPQCGRDDRLYMAFEVHGHLMSRNAEPIGEGQWSRHSECCCLGCAFTATAYYFMLDDETAPAVADALADSDTTSPQPASIACPSKATTAHGLLAAYAAAARIKQK